MSPFPDPYLGEKGESSAEWIQTQKPQKTMFLPQHSQEKPLGGGVALIFLPE